MGGAQLLARHGAPLAFEGSGERQEHAELVRGKRLELGLGERRDEGPLGSPHVLRKEDVGARILRRVGGAGEELEAEPRVAVGSDDTGDLVEGLPVHTAPSERELGPRGQDLHEVLPGVRSEGEAVGDAEAGTARRIEVGEEVLGGHEEERDRPELDLPGAGEQVDQLGLLLDEGGGLVEDDDEMLGMASQSLLEDVDHLREAVPAVRERDVDATEQVEHHGTVARPSPAVDVGLPNRELLASPAPLQVAREPTYERRLAAPDPSGDHQVVREALGERLPESLRGDPELRLPPDEPRRQVGGVERLLSEQDAGRARHGRSQRGRVISGSLFDAPSRTLRRGGASGGDEVGPYRLHELVRRATRIEGQPTIAPGQGTVASRHPLERSATLQRASPVPRRPSRRSASPGVRSSRTTRSGVRVAR